MPRRPAPDPSLPRVHFENAAGRLFEQAHGRRDGYVVVEHGAGPRRFGEVQTLLGHAKQLLAQRGWHKVLGDQRHMEPFAEEEERWVTSCWLNVARPQARALYGAVVLPAEDYARLSSEVALASANASAMTYRLFDDPSLARAWLEQLR
ncbi:MAG: hypothetical protein JWR44_2488 [Hymenobacter sp.]|jgi:hypothetical protein|nr:hypothetical protein [Hymenobacter sp.]